MKLHTHLLALFALVPLIPSSARPALVAATPQDEVLRTSVLKRADLVLDHYYPQSVSAGTLYDLASELAARWYLVSDSGSSESIQNLRVVGNSLLLYDVREEVERLKKFLASVDVPAPASKAPVEDEPETVVAEYAPRFLSMETVQMLVERHVMVNVIEERGVALFEGYPGDIAAAQATLKKLDVAPRQILLTCQLIEVDGESAAIPLPKELSDNLQKLLPGSKLAQVGMSMVRTSVGSRKRVSLRIATEEHSYGLGFSPVAFDSETRSMTIENCVLMPNSGGALFDTSVLLRADEYTVLAATGSKPMLLVVRLSTP
jgi:hypothetical protein